MDETRFDTLIRSLTESRSRRRFAGMLSGFTLVPLLAVADTAAKRKKKKKKKKKSPPAPPPPPPPPATCATTGCPYGAVCQAAGTCTHCLGEPCGVNGDCCTNFCDGTVACGCIPGRSSTPCVNDAQCCNGNCESSGHCACDPPGSPCDMADGTSCCSNDCRFTGFPFFNVCQ